MRKPDQITFSEEMILDKILERKSDVKTKDDYEFEIDIHQYDVEEKNKEIDILEEKIREKKKDIIELNDSIEWKESCISNMEGKNCQTKKIS